MNLYDKPDAWIAMPTPAGSAAISWRSGLADTGPGLPYLKAYLKFGARALMARSESRRWYGLLNSHPAFARFVARHPRMVLKIYRPYLSNALTRADRVEALASHYAFVFARGLERLTEQAAAAAVPMAQFEGKSGRPYTLALRAVGLMEREGELVLQLLDGDVAVCSLAFSFVRLHGGVDVYVGCVQGPRGPDGLALVREATRELHGTRPKNLLLNLARQLGYELGCRQAWLVGNANRAVHHQMRKAQVHADYDQLWQEAGARCAPGGDYVLACTRLAAPDLTDVPSKRRAEYRRRHDLHQRIAADLLRAFR